MKYGYGPKNIFTTDQLNEWKNVFKLNTITKTSNGDNCWGIDKKCLSYNWYKKTVMPVFQIFFQKPLKLIFASYIDCDETFPIHTDIKPLPDNEHGKHAVSILVPFTIDNKFENFNLISTNMFDKKEKKIYELKWESNSFIWWDSHVHHASSDYKSKGIKTKQYFITHTYV